MLFQSALWILLVFSWQRCSAGACTIDLTNFQGTEVTELKFSASSDVVMATLITYNTDECPRFREGDNDELEVSIDLNTGAVTEANSADQVAPATVYTTRTDVANGYTMAANCSTGELVFSRENSWDISVELVNPDDGSPVTFGPQHCSHERCCSTQIDFFVANERIYIVYKSWQSNSWHGRSAVAILDLNNLNLITYSWFQDVTSPLERIDVVSVIDGASVVEIVENDDSDCWRYSVYFYFNETNLVFLTAVNEFSVWETATHRDGPPYISIAPDGLSYMKIQNRRSPTRSIISDDEECSWVTTTFESNYIEIFSIMTGELERVVDLSLTDINNIVDPPESIPNPVCFSGEAIVDVQQRGFVKMKDLILGDKILVSDETYESVYSFGHKSDEVVASFLKIGMETTRSAPPLEISQNHMVRLWTENGVPRFVPASLLKVGDKLVTGSSGDPIAIRTIQRITRRGVYAPFTASGTLVVNHVIVSNYIAYQESEYVMVGTIETPITFQWLAHAFTTFLHRLVTRMRHEDEAVDEKYDESGKSLWIVKPHDFFSWLLDQHSILVLVILLPAIGSIIALDLVARILSFQYTTLSITIMLVLATSVVVTVVAKRPTKGHGSSWVLY